MTKMDITQQQLLQPVDRTNPLVYFDICIGQESGKRIRISNLESPQSLSDLHLHYVHVFVCVYLRTAQRDV